MTEPTRPEGLAAEETQAANVIPTTYVGVKRIEAWPQPESDAHGKPIPDGRPGYAVRYPDGYTSWSPADVFESAYIQVQPDKAEIAVDAAQTILNAIASGLDVNFTGPAFSTESGDAIAEVGSPIPGEVDLRDLDHKIVAEYSFTLEAAVGEGVPLHPRLSSAMASVLVMENGTVITGMSAPIRDSNYSDDLGRRFARRDAIGQAINLEAYLLRQRIHCQEQATKALATDAGLFLDQLSTDAQLWANALTITLDGHGAFANAEAADTFTDLALGWFASAIERARDEGLRQNPSFDPDAADTPDFKAIVVEQLEQVGYRGTLEVMSPLVGEAVEAAMGRAYARGLARTTFPARRMVVGQRDDEQAILDHPWPQGETTLLYQISGPDLDRLQKTLEAVAEGGVVPASHAAYGLKIIAEAIAERDGGIMVGDALCDVGRPEGAEPDAGPQGGTSRPISDPDPDEDDASTATMADSLRPVAEAPAENNARAGAGSASNEETISGTRGTGSINGFRIGEGFTRDEPNDEERDPRLPRE